MTCQIFFDFDGTLLDSRQRQYQLFRELVPECRLGFDGYWRIKRRRVTQAELLRERYGYTAERIRQIQSDWLRMIEHPDLLRLDRPFDGIGAMLERLAGTARLYLVTARQRPEMVVAQIEDFGWRDLFAALLVTEQRMRKADLIRGHVAHGVGDLIVGDTGEDVLEGRKLGLHTVAVSYGTLNRRVLREYEPDAIVASPVMLGRYLDSGAATT